LEKQDRRLKWMGVTAPAAVSAIFFIGQAVPTPRTVEAQKFVLKDAQGNVRGGMSTSAKGSELTLGNVKAQPMIRLVVSADSSDLHLFGCSKSSRNLSMDSGNPGISMIAAQGNGEARIAFNEYGPSFTLQDAKGFSTIVGAAPAEKADESQVWNCGRINARKSLKAIRSSLDGRRFSTRGRQRDCAQANA
jgi:hypothetical protein